MIIDLNDLYKYSFINIDENIELHPKENDLGIKKLQNLHLKEEYHIMIWKN